MRDGEPKTSDVLLEQTREGVRILRLNRPERKNALTDELGWAIVAAFERAASDDRVRVVGVTGQGDAFCSGADLAPSPPATALSPGDEVVDAEGFESRFLAYCQQLAGVAPIAARQTKRLVTRVGLPVDLEAHLREEMSYVHRGLSSEDGREAVRALLEKRKPEFRGR